MFVENMVSPYTSTLGLNPPLVVASPTTVDGRIAGNFIAKGWLQFTRQILVVNISNFDQIEFVYYHKF